MRPWLFQFGPLFIPDDARRELMEIRAGLTPAEYVEKVGGLRAEASATAGNGWPKKGCSDASPPLTANVTKIKFAKRSDG